MWRQTVCVCALVIGVWSQAPGANAQVLLEFADGDLPLIKGVVEAAAGRLARCNCQKVVSDFVDEEGVPLGTRLATTGKDAVAAFRSLRFVNSPLAPQCRDGNRLAFTAPGSQVIYICSLKLRNESLRRSARTEFVMIHEFLHALGLGENPPTSQQITARVAARCAVAEWAATATATESHAVAADQPSRMAPDARVRGVSARVVGVINGGAARSSTFRALVDQIGRTDGIVYIAEGQCGNGVRACLLLTMTLMGPNRVLRILVDPKKEDCELVGSIGHELQHAIEVLSHRTVRSGSAMTLLYKKEGSKGGGHFETDAAIKAGNAVRAELRESATTETHCE